MAVFAEKHMEYKFDPSDEQGAEKLAAMFSPAQVDHMIRQAIHWCWMSLPRDRKTVVEVEQQIRRLVDRALKDFREDAEQLGRK
jgi:hypothetical protein